MKEFELLTFSVGTSVTGEPVVAVVVLVVVVVVLVVVVVVEVVGGLIPSQSFDILTSAQFQNFIQKRKYLVNEMGLINC